MKYTRRTVKSRPGMTQEQALESLQDHPMFKSGSKIASIRKRGKVWVADILEPKTAEFPPSEDEETDTPEASSEDTDSEDEPKDDSPFGESGDSDSDTDSEESGEENPEEELGEIDDLTDGAKGKDEKIMMLLEQILDAVAPHPELEHKHHGDDAPLDLPMDGPLDGPPMDGPDEGPAGPPMPKTPAGAKLKPGETRNTPGATPIGAPAFSSVKAATFVASRPANVTIKQAKAELDAEFGPQGYEVKKIKREGNVLKALVTKR